MTLSKRVWVYEVDKMEDVSKKGHHFRGGMGKSEFWCQESVQKWRAGGDLKHLLSLPKTTGLASTALLAKTKRLVIRAATCQEKHTPTHGEINYNFPPKLCNPFPFGFLSYVLE